MSTCCADYVFGNTEGLDSAGDAVLYDLSVLRCGQSVQEGVKCGVDWNDEHCYPCVDIF